MPVSKPSHPSENTALPGVSNTVDNGSVAAKNFFEGEKWGSSGGKTNVNGSNSKLYGLTSSSSAPLIPRAINSSSVGGGDSGDGGNGSSGVNAPVAYTRGGGQQGVRGELVGINNGFVGDNTGWGHGTGYPMYGGGYGGYYGGR